MSVVICDPSRFANGDPAYNEELVVSVFRPKEIELPLDLAPGDVILFRGVRITIYNNKTKAQAFSQSNNTWVILKNERDIKLPNGQNELNPPLNKAEVDRMVQLYHWYKAENGGIVQNSDLDNSFSRISSFSVPKEERLLGDVGPNEFFHAIFKIMHVVRNQRKPELELYVTDGTISQNYQPRNFHNIEIADLPQAAIYTLAIHDTPPLHEIPNFDVGNVLKLSNVRSKLYKGELELSWSELPTSEQARQGWSRRRLAPIRQEDEKAKLIERCVGSILSTRCKEGIYTLLRIRRLRALKRGEVYDEPGQPRPATPKNDHQSKDPFQNSTAYFELDSTRLTNRNQATQLAKHFKTIHTDLTEHPVSTIQDIIASSTVPNKYRVTAKVKSVHPRNLEKNDTLIQSFCKHCKSTFKSAWCGSCNDSEGMNAEYKYRFVCILEDQKGDELACLVGDDEAAEFLPPLPPYSTSTNPNDLRKSDRRRTELSGEVYNILQGAKMNGVRTKPYIDMSLEVYHIVRPFNTEQNGEEEKFIVARMFGMTSASIA
uniref:Telomeric single stranded DNA binding POT1/Cdc13 domain-containing protein n=1 Tax=Kwoniella pini CBS 10737 TaxID=1296096 RepID=A0A1B9HWW8_9TREE|nr:uncharacterized protein I206_06677 [Kwoniella pini CBS 10737]OCF47770.1 hypothetical protein I206_06677 [Kwoniella pini CBS 10737]